MKNLSIKSIFWLATISSSIAFAEVSLDQLMGDGVDYDSDTTKTVTTKSIAVPLLNKPKSMIKRPARSDKQTTVLDRFGEPLKKHRATGNPPISKWDYPDFTVYFESGFVIHSVIKTNQ